MTELVNMSQRLKLTQPNSSKRKPVVLLTGHLYITKNCENIVCNCETGLSNVDH